MASASFVGINEGDDRNLATVQRSIASTTVEQTEVAVTLPHVPSYTMVTSAPVALATASSHLFQFMGSGLNRDLLRRVEITQVGNAAASRIVEFELRRLDTSGSGGTAVTPNTVDPVDSASTARGMILPSSKGTEDELLYKKSGVILQTAATVGHREVATFEFPEGTTKPVTTAAGSTTGWVLKNMQSDSTATLLISVTYEEVFWS